MPEGRGVGTWDGSKPPRACGADRASGLVEKLQGQIRLPGNLTAQLPPTHNERGILRGLMTPGDRRADGGAGSFCVRIVGVGESADAVGKRLGRVVGLAGVQDLNLRMLKGGVGNRVVNADDRRRRGEREASEQVGGERG